MENNKAEITMLVKSSYDEIIVSMINNKHTIHTTFMLLNKTHQQEAK